VAPIRQQNPPGPLKLFGLRKKQAKIPIFDFAKKDRFFRHTFFCFGETSIFGNRKYDARRCDDAILSPSQVLEAPKYFKVLLACAKSTAH
jgi:hypothetical protein